MIPLNLSSLIANVSSPKYDPLYPLGDRGMVGSWQLAAPYKVGQKLPLNAIWPRPDNETDVNSYLRNAHPNIEYVQPICIQGGERPLRFTIIAAPGGTTISGEMSRTYDPVTGLVLHTRQKDFGVVRWTPTSGTQTFTIRVTDQSGATLDVTWTVTVDATKFVIVDAATATSGSGTWASPLKTWADLWGNDANATFANKIAYFKAGTYTVHSAGGLHCSINTNVKPLAYIGAETGGVIFNNTTGHFYANRGDVAFRNIAFTGCVTTEANVRIIQVSVKDRNYLFDNLTFSNNVVGTVANDNPACIIFMDNDTYSYNIALINSTFDNTCTISAYDNFNCDGVLLENNVLTYSLAGGTNSTIGLHVKDDTRNVTVVFNTTIGVFPDGHIRMSNQQNRLAGAYNQEVCYNVCIDLSLSSAVFSPIVWNQNATSFINALNTHCYRNTIKAAAWTAITAVDWMTAGVNYYVKTTGNAYFAGSFVDGGAYTPIGTASVSLTSAQINSLTGALTTVGNARATYLGTVGAEIAST